MLIVRPLRAQETDQARLPTLLVVTHAESLYNLIRHRHPD
jgi:hypothetical protein